MKSINKSMNNKNDERYTPPILVEPILKYIKPNSTIDGSTASFNTSYFCRNILPKDLMFYHLENNNTGGNCIGSRMAYRVVE